MIYTISRQKHEFSVNRKVCLSIRHYRTLWKKHNAIRISPTLYGAIYNPIKRMERRAWNEEYSYLGRASFVKTSPSSFVLKFLAMICKSVSRFSPLPFFFSAISCNLEITRKYASVDLRSWNLRKCVILRGKINVW